VIIKRSEYLKSVLSVFTAQANRILRSLDSTVDFRYVPEQLPACATMDNKLYNIYVYVTLDFVIMNTNSIIGHIRI
jgi:hypothetical protein